MVYEERLKAVRVSERTLLRRLAGGFAWGEPEKGIKYLKGKDAVASSLFLPADSAEPYGQLISGLMSFTLFQMPLPELWESLHCFHCAQSLEASRGLSYSRLDH